MRCLAACLLLSVLPLSPGWAASFPVGSWFGQGQPYDKSEMWLAHMLPNGDFRAEFRSCVKGKARDLAQTGSWSLTGDLETITVITVNGQFFPHNDTYKILSQNGKKQTYRYLRSGFDYTSTRVDDKFELPSCELTS